MNVLINGDEARATMNKLKRSIDDDTLAIKKMEKEMEGLEKYQMTNSSRYHDLQREIAAATLRIKENKAAIVATRNQMSVTDMTISELRAQLRQLNAIFKEIDPNSEEWAKYQKELFNVKNRLKELQTQVPQAEGMLKRLWNSASGAVAILRSGWMILGRIANRVRNAFNTIKDFEQANVNLASILGTSVGLIQNLTNQALALGQTTRYTASEVTGLQTELAKLGFAQRDIIQMTESVLNFATAVGAELPEAAALAGATLRMFGLRASDTDDVMGTLALSTNKSALSFSFLQTAMSIVGPVARTFGFNIKDTTALLGTLANAGFDASSAATATRNILLNLADANGKLAKALGGPVSTFPELLDGLKQLNAQGVDLATTLELTDKRSVSAFNAFLSGTDSAKALREELEETGGVLQDIADQRMNTVEGSVASLQSAWERFILAMRNSQGTIKKTIDLLTDLVRGITPGEEADPNETARRTSSYVGGLWRMYYGEEDGVDKILQAISDDEKKMEQGLDNAEAKLERASGILAKRRAKKEIQYYQEGLAVISGARQELTDRLKWEAGSYDDTDEKVGEGGSSGIGDSDGSPKKGTKSWSLQADEGYLAAKAELTRQYNEGAIKSQEEYEERIYQLEVSSLQARLALNKEKGTERIKIENDIQNKTMAHNAKVLKDQQKAAEEAKKIEEQIQQARIAASDKYNEKAEAQVAVENARFEKEMKQLEKKKGQIKDYDRAVETLQRQHDNNLRKIELDRLSAEMKDLESAHKTALAEIQRQNEYELQLDSTSSARKLEIRRKRDEAVAAENLKFAQQQYQFLQGIVSSGEIAGMALSKEQLAQYKLQLEEVRKQLQDADAALKNQTTSSAFSGTGDASLFGVSQKDWETFFANLADSTLKAKDLQTAITGIGGAAQEGFKIANQAIQLTNAKEKKALDDYKKGQESRKKELEARYKAGLMTESQYNDEVEQMEADMQAKQEEADLRQAERTKKMSIIESIINTALGVTKTLAQWGVPAGIAPAAIMAAMGAAQTAMIYAQPTGYAEGGEIQVQRAQDGRSFRAKVDPARRGYVDRPTVLVGEEGPEYVISAEALKNPDIRAYADTIEQARRTGRLRSLRMEAVRPAQPVVGRAEGGFTQDGASAGSIGVSPAVMQDLARLSETVDRLSAILEDGIEAEVVMTGRKGLVRRFEEYNRMKSRGQL